VVRQQLENEATEVPSSPCFHCHNARNGMSSAYTRLLCSFCDVASRLSSSKIVARNAVIFSTFELRVCEVGEWFHARESVCVWKVVIVFFAYFERWSLFFSGD
jgi:hypothetical protein